MGIFSSPGGQVRLEGSEKQDDEGGQRGRCCGVKGGDICGMSAIGSGGCSNRAHSGKV